MNGAADTFRLSHSGLEQGRILRLLCLGRVTPIMFVFTLLLLQGFTCQNLVMHTETLSSGVLAVHSRINSLN